MYVFKWVSGDWVLYQAHKDSNDVREVKNNEKFGLTKIYGS